MVWPMNRGVTLRRIHSMELKGVNKDPESGLGARPNPFNGIESLGSLFLAL